MVDRYLKAEEEVLKQHYQATDRAELLKLLPKRNWLSIRRKALKMGIERARTIKYARFFPRRPSKTKND